MASMDRCSLINVSECISSNAVFSAGEEIPDYLERYERNLWNSLAVRNFWLDKSKPKSVLQPDSSPLKKEREIEES